VKNHGIPRLLVAAFGLGAVLLTGCYTVPVTGRKALNLTSDQEVARMSQLAFTELKSRHRLSTDRAQVDRVQRIGERLARVAHWDVPYADWEFVVFDAPQQINAFAMAGGKVGVYSGLFRIAETDDELAAVLAHEIAHVTARHVHERLSQEILRQTGGVAVGVAMIGSGAPSLTTSAVLDAYGLSSGMGSLVFDRAKEREADAIGLIYMARAGYDPDAALRVLEKLDEVAAQRRAPPAWLSTHPSTHDRMLQMIDNLPRAREIYRQTQTRPVIGAVP
jgi:metalloendopeptidase OMA1, mitochondrial